jgi:hypothetical protein
MEAHRRGWDEQGIVCKRSITTVCEIESNIVNFIIAGIVYVCLYVPDPSDLNLDAL